MSGSIPPAASSCIMSAVPDRGTPVTTVTNPGSEDSRVATSAQSRKRERSAAYAALRAISAGSTIRLQTSV
jgi:hypothetical protein